MLFLFGAAALGTLISPSKTTYTNASNECEVVKKIDGTIDKRECDLQELCKDAKFFEQKINTATNLDDLKSAQESYSYSILGLGSYKSEDIDRVCYGITKAQTINITKNTRPPSEPKKITGECNASPFELFEVGKTYHINDLAPILEKDCPGYVTKKNDGLIIKWNKNEYILRTKKPETKNNDDLYIIYQISQL